MLMLFLLLWLATHLSMDTNLNVNVGLVKRMIQIF